MWTKNDVRHFNTDWSDVVCKRKNVKIIKFEISHKFIDSCTTVRWTMLSWFVKLFDNYETLKNAKSDTWNEFTIAYRDLIVTFRNLFNFSFHYKNILYRFFAIVKFTNFDFLSNALICWKQWTFFAMIKKKDFFLKSWNIFIETIIKWKMTIICQIIQTFQIVKTIEKQTFDVNFYFRFRNKHSENLLNFLSKNEKKIIRFIEKNK